MAQVFLSRASRADSRRSLATRALCNAAAAASGPTLALDWPISDILAIKMVDLGKYQQIMVVWIFFVASRLHSQHSRHLWHFLRYVNFACLKVLKCWMRRLGLFVRCVAASLAFPASLASGTCFLTEKCARLPRRKKRVFKSLHPTCDFNARQSM